MKNDNKKWIQNAISYIEKSDAGTCPFCNSPEIEADIIQVGRRSINMKCKTCGRFTHIDFCVIDLK